MNRRGFTLIELMTTLSIIGLLASIALPKYQSLRRRATAAEVASNITTLRLGAFQYNESSGTWPATTAVGTVPKGVATYLPANGKNVIQGTSYQLGWSSTGVNGKGRRSVQTIQAKTTDATLCQALYGLMGGARNIDLQGSCTKKGGNVFLTVDR